MKKIILLFMCICMTGCSTSAGNTAASVEDTVTVAAETTTVTTTAAPETTTVTTTTAPETTTVTTTTAPETTTVTTTAAPETTTVTTTAAPETTTVTTTTAPETTAVTTTTLPETTTAKTTTATEVAVDGHKVIEMEGKRYKLTFEDEFDGTSLDMNKWQRCPEWKRQDLNCYWEDDMSYLDGNGNLILETSSDDEGNYFCGAVRTKGKFEQVGGYFEIRCTVNTIPGYWTAFWLMGETVENEANGGVNGTEIDIMESAHFNTGEIQNTLHWDGYGFRHKSIGSRKQVDVYDGEYHTFSLLWTEDEYVFYIDGEESWRTKAEEAQGICEAPLYMKITAETGSWTMPDDGINGLPDYMKIDYVRAYSEQ